jgi:indole-3-glycerol phosphate synthase
MSSSSASTSAASSILERIFTAKRAELEAERAVTPIAAIRDAARRAPAARDFLAALNARRPAIIAEIKRASPSKGDILPGLDPAAVARDYAAAGAAAISVLTDRHFKGSLEDLRMVRAAVDLPLLRKDFIFDPYQLHQARAAGADCILLIAAMLKEPELRALYAAARELGLQALVEVHNEDELSAAGRAGAEIVGINNRDLHTFVTDIAVTERLLKGYRGAALVVSESGIDTPEDIRRLERPGARAFLIGESLLRGGHPRQKLEALCSALTYSGPTICDPGRREG